MTECNLIFEYINAIFYNDILPISESLVAFRMLIFLSVYFGDYLFIFSFVLLIMSDEAIGAKYDET